jgi:hypothetical protein
MHQKWEYRTEPVRQTAYGDLDIEDQLNHLGQEGWELVNTVVHDSNLYVLLKRPTAASVRKWHVERVA